MASIVQSFKNATITFKRKSAGSYVNGIWEAGSETTSQMDAVIQFLSGQKLLSLPEEFRTQENIRLYTEQQLKTLDESAGTLGDIVVWNDVEYEVFQVQNRLASSLPHFVSFASKRPVSANQRVVQ